MAMPSRSQTSMKPPITVLVPRSDSTVAEPLVSARLKSSRVVRYGRKLTDSRLKPAIATFIMFLRSLLLCGRRDVARVEHVSQRVADHVEGKDAQGERQAWCHRHPRGLEDKADAVADEVDPVRIGRLDRKSVV